MPASPHRQTMHRRGLSFDQHQRSPIRRQHQQGIMNMTNVQQIGQQILREAQQQKTTRPGQQYIQTDLPMQPQCGVYTGSTPNTPYEQMTMDSMMHNSPNVQYAIPPYYAHEMSPMPNGYHGMGFDENNPHYFQQTHSVPQDGSFDARRMSQPDMRMQNGMRPHTPQQQIQNGKKTPVEISTRADLASAIPTHTALHTNSPACPICKVAAVVTSHSFAISGANAARSIVTRNHRT